jgi:hypothetical protein
MDGFFLDNPNDNAPAAPVSGGLLVFPGDYVVLTPDTAFVTHHYQNVAPERLVTMSLPSMPDDTGTLILLWSDGLENLVMESVSYSEDNHSALLRAAEREGVSLERLSMDHPADEPVNWTSAAQQLSGLPGTPTQPNSQALHPGAASHQVLFLPVNRLSPDGDGREDFLEMHYRMPASGYAASLTVYDSGGLPVKRLLRHSLAGVEGFVRWDGDDDAGAIVRPGIYVLYFEFFSPENTVQRLRKSVAVVGTF